MKKDEIFITSAKRTAVGSLNKSLKNVPAFELGATVISNIVEKSKIKSEEVDEVILGQVLTGGLGQNPARQAAIKSGIPKEKPAYIVNQVCGSGIRSIVSAYQSIKLGDSKIVVAGGQENMSLAPHAIHLRDGKKLGDTGPERIMVFQEGALFPWLTVIDNVEYGLKVSGIPQKERNEISKRYLDMMQLTQFANSYTYQLSTGMKQRVAIARALVMDPDVLLMDEPFAALDSQTRDLLLVEMQLIWQKTQKTIIFVTHNVPEAAVLGSRVAVFSARPSIIKKVIDIDYKRPRVAEDENLSVYEKEILSSLRHQGPK